jgi:hypothetical protein
VREERLPVNNTMCFSDVNSEAGQSFTGKMYVQMNIDCLHEKAHSHTCRESFYLYSKRKTFHVCFYLPAVVKKEEIEENEPSHYILCIQSPDCSARWKKIDQKLLRLRTLRNIILSSPFTWLKARSRFGFCYISINI